MKYIGGVLFVETNESPSTRREWIEILKSANDEMASPVSLHTEGVD